MAGHLELLHPSFLPLAKRVLVHVAHLASLSGVDWYISESFRTPKRQWELYKRGRKRVGVDWVRVQGEDGVTNAQPHQTPHCVMREGKPGSCAIDIALVLTSSSGSRKWLPDDDPRWGIIPTSCGLVGAEVVSGAMWRSIRDWPHVELRSWREHRG